MARLARLLAAGACGLAIGLLGLTSAAAATTLYAGGGLGPPYGIGALAIDEDGGSSPLPGSPFPPPGAVGVTGIALSADGDTLVGTSRGGGQVARYPVLPGGALGPAEVHAFPAPPDPDPDGVAVVRTGGSELAFVADGGRGRIDAYPLGGDVEFAPLPSSTPLAGDMLNGVAATPDGRRLYVAETNGKRIHGFAVGEEGALSPLDPPFAPTTVSPAALSLTPDGRFLYAGNLVGPGIDGFSIGEDGDLTPLAGTPFPATGETASVAVSPTGRRLYASSGTSSVHAFNLGEDGIPAPAAGSPFPVPGHEVDVVAVDPSGELVATAGGALATNLTVLRLGTNGDLTEAPGYPSATGTLLPFFTGFRTAPEQPPTAAFTATADPAAGSVTLDASASTDPEGDIALYRWQFGDGSRATTTSPVTTHAYGRTGNFNVTLTVEDATGCSTEFVYTGQTASCNGGPGASVTRPVDLEPPPDSSFRLSLGGKKRQRLGRTVSIKARCTVDCRLVIGGKVTRKAGRAWRTVRGFGLKRKVVNLGAEARRTIKVRVPRTVVRRGRAMLRSGRRLRAAIRVVPSSGERRIAARTRFVKLYR